MCGSLMFVRSFGPLFCPKATLGTAGAYSVFGGEGLLIPLITAHPGAVFLVRHRRDFTTHYGSGRHSGVVEKLRAAALTIDISPSGTRPRRWLVTERRNHVHFQSQVPMSLTIFKNIG